MVVFIGYTSAKHLVFSRLVGQPKPPNLRTLVLSLLLFLGELFNKMASPKSVFVSPGLGTCQMLSTVYSVHWQIEVSRTINQFTLLLSMLLSQTHFLPSDENNDHMEHGVSVVATVWV